MRAWELSAARNVSEKQTWNSGQKEVKERGLDLKRCPGNQEMM